MQESDCSASTSKEINANKGNYMEDGIGTTNATCIEKGNYTEERCCREKRQHKCRIIPKSDRVIVGAKVSLSWWMPHQ